jgi:hypothetical protein
METRRGGAWPVGLEALASVGAIAITVTLIRDDRTTTVDAVALWAGALWSATPLAARIATRADPVPVDLVAGLATTAAGTASFTIGGLALLAPAFFLGFAATVGMMRRPGSVKARRLVAIAAIALGAILFVFGMASIVGVVLAPTGLLLILWGTTAPRA